APNTSRIRRVRSERGNRELSRRFMQGGGGQSRREPVADAPYRLYPARLFRVVFNVAPQAQYGDIDGAVVAFTAVVVARQRQQAFARQRLAGVAYQGFQQVDFAAGQLDRLAVAQQLPQGRVEYKGPEADRHVLGQRRRAALASQYRFDARQQFAGIERLAQIVVGAGLQAYDAVHRLVARRQQDDGDIFALFAQPAAGIGAVATGQHAVEHQQVRGVAGDARGQVAGVGGQQRVVAMPVEIVGQQLAQGGVVVDDQQLGMRIVHGRHSVRGWERRQGAGNRLKYNAAWAGPAGAT